jgi:AcrR family transcriptional regulator
MLISAAEVMRERGAAGVTIDEVLTRSGAPRGSVYYHFPDGRNQIVAEALRYAGDAITADIDDAAGRGAKVLVREFVKFWERALADFAHWRTALTRAFVADGFPEPDADSLAVMSIAALEGAVVLCRSTRSADPLRKVHDQLEFLVKAREFVRRNGLSERRD